MSDTHVVVIGAGVGGLVAALLLAARGVRVTLVEAAASPGGKMREVVAAGQAMDAGPTVFTMRWVFEAIFAEAGESLADHVSLQPVTTLARHAWNGQALNGHERLDLFAERAASADAIAQFSSPDEGRRYLAFCREASAMYHALERSFMSVEKPSPLGLVRRAGIANMWRTRPFSSMWSALCQHFKDPRLRQLFGRYATYCGSSPFLAPATLMLIAHVEQEGVWLVEGGMHQLAKALAKLVAAKGGTIRYGAKVDEICVEGGQASGVRLATGEVIAADAVVCNGDSHAIASGLLGAGAAKAVPQTPAASRALSAVTWNMVADTSGFGLTRHNVFFSGDYKAEFQRILAARALPTDPTVYICAQDRDDMGASTNQGPERLLILVNAPATGAGPDVRSHEFTAQEIARCQHDMLNKLESCGLRITQQQPPCVTTPVDFARLFPATGGALYGRATHGAMASFARPGSRTRLKGLYLAGGSVHPGAGVPMVALSGQIAVQSLMADLASIRRSRPAATAGGMSMA